MTPRRAVAAPPRDREVGDVDLEAMPATKATDEARDVAARDLPRAAAVRAVEGGMLRGREHVILLAPVGGVAVSEIPELLEDVERTVDRRGRRIRIAGAAAVDELGRGDV